MDSVLEIKRLRKEYKGFTLNDVSFSLPEGFIMGLIGPNGAGKTTIIKLVMNLIRRNAGEIKVFGLDNIRSEAEIKARIGFVYDNPFFYDDISLKSLKSAIAPFYPKWDERLFQKLMEEFDLPLKKKFKTLSHGMKMKFALAIAMSHDADLLILDEPTAGLDPVFRIELLDRLAALMENERKSVLFSTHITTDLERIADYITFIKDGEIVFTAAKDEILENWAVVKTGRDRFESDGVPGLRGYRRSEYGVEALTSDAGAARQALSRDDVLERASLEDIMFFMSKGERHG